MRIGILADIHGNLRGLEAILRIFQLHDVKRIICLGDMIGYYHQSLEVLDQLMKLNATCILGNHEAYLLGYLNCSPERWQAYFLDQVKENISTQHLEWLSELPRSLEIDINGRYMAFFHGSPWNPLEEYIYPDSNRFTEFTALKWNYVFLGHTHYPMLKQEKNINIINPGSCGQPRDKDLRSSAAVFDLNEEQIFFVREPYDTQSTIKEAELAGVSSIVIKKLKEV